MSRYQYSDRQLREWPQAAAATAYWEQARHAEQLAAYWQHRARSAERRMTEHDCREGNHP